jgi:hypothetical protein
VINKSPEAFAAYGPAPYVRVAVEAASGFPPGVVEVEKFNFPDADERVDFRQDALEAGSAGGQVVTHSVGVAGVDAQPYAPPAFLADHFI